MRLLRASPPSLPLARRAIVAAIGMVTMTAAMGQPPAPPPIQPPPQPVAVPEPIVDASNRIVEVRIEGNHATEVSKLPKLVTRAGQIFDPQVIEEE